MGTLALGNHDLVALKVRQVLADGSLGEALGRRRGVPLAHHVLGSHLLGNDRRASTTRHLHRQLCQRQTAQMERLASNAAQGPVDDDAVVVDDLDDDGNLALQLAVVDQDEAANFNKAAVYLQRGER